MNRNKLSMTLSISLICFIIGMLFALYNRYSGGETPDSNAFSERMDNLVSTISDLEQEINAYEGQIESYRQELAEIESYHQTSSVQLMQEELHMAKLRAGLTQVSGPGLRLVLEDNTLGQRESPHADPNQFIIHYEDLLSIVADLKAAGAEAIAINDQRLVTNSELRCVGNVIMVNTSRVAPPFIIQAIGNAAIMGDMVSYGRYDYLLLNHFPISMTQEEEVILPAYKGDLQFTYIHEPEEEPAEGEDDGGGGSSEDLPSLG